MQKSEDLAKMQGAVRHLRHHLPFIAGKRALGVGRS